MNRRDFIVQSLIAGVTVPHLTACASGMQRGEKELYQISLAEWSLHRTIRAKVLDHLDFARAARRDFGIDAVEYVNQFFADKATDRPYLKEMKQRAAAEGVRSLLIMIDSEGNLGDVESGKRREA